LIQGGQDSLNAVRKPNMLPACLHTCMCLHVYTVYTYVHALYMCMHICMCVYIHTCMYAPMDARMRVSICIYTINLLSRTIYPATPQNVCVCVCACVNPRECCMQAVCMDTRGHVFMHMDTQYVCIYTCTYVYIHTCICIRVYIHVYRNLCMYIYTRTHMCVYINTNIKSYIYLCLHTKYSLKNNLLCYKKHTLKNHTNTSMHTHTRARTHTQTHKLPRI